MSGNGDFDWPEEPVFSPAGGFLIQHRWGVTRPLEVVVPWPDGGLANFWRSDTIEATDGAIAMATHEGDVFAAWIGSGNEGINVARLALVGDPDNGYSVVGLENKVTLGDDFSDETPALASHHGRLFLAWKGVGNKKLNLMFSSDNGRTFQGKRTLGDRSDASPALASHSNRLFLAWKGSGNEELNLAKVVLFGSTAGNFGIEGTEEWHLIGETSPQAPSLASHKGKLFVAWRGAGNTDLNLMFSSDGAAFEGKQSFAEDADEFVSIASSSRGLFVAWKKLQSVGLGGPVKVARVTLIGTTTGGFGIEGLQKVSAGVKSVFAPSLASVDGSLVLAWRRDDAQLGFMTSNDRGGTFGAEKSFGHALQWHGPARFGAGEYAGATVLESDFRADPENRTGNLEVIASRSDGRVDHFWRDNTGSVWHGPFDIPVIQRGNGACGPSMYYSGAYFLEEDVTGIDFEEHGRNIFVAVVPNLESGFTLYFRINPASDEGEAIHWKAVQGHGDRPVVGLAIAKLVRQPAGATFMETAYKDEGPGVSDGVPSIVAEITYAGRLRLHKFNFADFVGQQGVFDGPSLEGVSPFPALDGEFTGQPGLLEGDYGYRPLVAAPFLGHFGGLELIAPSKLGGAIHFHHDGGTNGGPGHAVDQKWSGGTRIPGPLVYDDLSFIESTFESNDTHHLEMVARTKNQRGFDFYFRDGNLRWHGPQRVPATLGLPAGRWLESTPGAGRPKVAAGTSPTSWYTTPENVQHIAYV
ncbi:hypothetical protein ACFC58_31530, partial [Kitasatospora purpeofusca]|uniref:hypothetical protein n=1 Tax=Kitasatospora purpeofusca TaxID=67352 RepID=UPI0035D938EF